MELKIENKIIKTYLHNNNLLLCKLYKNYHIPC